MALPTLDIEEGSPANTGRKSEFLDAKNFNFWVTLRKINVFQIFSGQTSTFHTRNTFLPLWYLTKIKTFSFLFYGEGWNWPKMAAQALDSTAPAIERQDWTGFYFSCYCRNIAFIWPLQKKLENREVSCRRACIVPKVFRHLQSN